VFPRTLHHSLWNQIEPTGTFQKLSLLAELNRLRIVCVNRREYPGSSPYTAQELKVLNEGTDAERVVGSIVRHVVHSGSLVSAERAGIHYGFNCEARIHN
jgi:hypothetical protein